MYVVYLKIYVGLEKVKKYEKIYILPYDAAKQAYDKSRIRQGIL